MPGVFHKHKHELNSCRIHWMPDGMEKTKPHAHNIYSIMYNRKDPVSCKKLNLKTGVLNQASQYSDFCAYFS